MKININGESRDMTPEEIEQYENSKNIEKQKYLALSYPQRVEYLIRERYTTSDEFAILRQRDTKPDEFAEYNAYAEECKIKAQEDNYE